ncbi:MAG: hypothetical protein ACR2H2_01200 [Solirubrobacteraceae bacterium]
MPAPAAAGLIAPAGSWPAPVTGAANPLAGSPYVLNGAHATAHARLRIWLRVSRRARMAITRTVGERTVVWGELRSADTHRAIIGATLTLVAADVYAGRWVALGSSRTSQRGRFRAVIPVTWRHLRVAVIYYPAVTSAVPVYSRRLLVRSSARVWLGVPHRKARAVRFRGRVGGGPVPASGLVVALQVRNAFGRWVTARLARTRPDGRYRIGYRFPRGGRLTVRVLMPGRQPGWPLYAGASARVGIRLR